MTPAEIEAALELAINLIKVGTDLYAQIKAANATDDPVALQAILEKLEAANDALMGS